MTNNDERLHPFNQMGTLRVVMLCSPTLEMSRTTAFLCCFCAAPWRTCSCAPADTKTARCDAVATSGLETASSKLLDFGRWRVEALSRSPFVLFYFIFISLGTWITASNFYHLGRRLMVLLSSISPTPGGQVFILVFSMSLLKCFARSWDHHACQESNTCTALTKTREVLYWLLEWSPPKKKKARRRNGSWKEHQDIVETKNPRTRTFGAKAYKSTGNKNSSKWT